MSDHSLLSELIDRLESRESLDLEFKLAQGNLPNALWETVSAFANTNGGWIVLGVDDSTNPPRFIGVPRAHERLQDFFNLLHNRNKISYRACAPGDASIEVLGERELIVIRVPAAPRRERPVHIGSNPFQGTFIRAHTGDYRCDERDVNRMIREKSGVGSDSVVLDYYGLEALDQGAVRAYRQRFQNANPDSPFNAYDDPSFLRAIDALKDDPATKRSGVTVAGLLMLGSSQAIRHWRDRHLIEFRLVSESDSWDYRWDDRIVCEGNLLETFQIIYPRLTSALPVPFQLDGPYRRAEGPIHVAVREALVNLLVHEDYTETQSSLIVRSARGFFFRNPGTSRVPEADLGISHESDPRNPILVRMMRQIGLADEAGSGMAKIFGAWRESGFVPPSIQVSTERYEFRIELRYVGLLFDDDRGWLESLGGEWSEAEQMALLHARHAGFVDNPSLRSLVEIHPADATKILGSLRDQNLLSMSGWARGTRYELTAYASATIENVEASPLNGSPGNGAGATDGADHEADLQIGRVAAAVRDKGRLTAEERDDLILLLCSIKPLSVPELGALLSRSPATVRTSIQKLMGAGRIDYLHPDRPTHPRQRYVTVEPDPAVDPLSAIQMRLEAIPDGEH